MKGNDDFVSIYDIRKAVKAIDRYVTSCPLIYSPHFSKMTGKNIYLKAENFQPTKVFKIRGIVNKLQSLKNQDRVVTASSGNHGLSLAYASKIFKKRAKVYVPEWANPDKIKTITSFGAEVVVGGDSYEAAYSEALKYSKAENVEFVHPFEDPLVIAGQGTIGLEIAQDKPEIDAVVVPVGGGGLISGISIAIKSFNSNIKVLGVQGENNPTMIEAFRLGKRIERPIKKSIADGLIAKNASDITLNIIKKNVDEMVGVSEEEIERALLELLVHDHILVEPSGAASAAILLSKTAILTSKENIAIVLSGGNISINYLSDLLGKLNH